MIATEDLGRTSLAEAICRMDQGLAALVAGQGPERLLVFEPRPVISLGRHTQASSLRLPLDEIRAQGLATLEVSRGGDVTWHGPGQLVCFPLVRLAGHGLDVYAFIDLLIRGVAETLAAFGVAADPPGEGVGVWVGQKKIASIGLRHEDGVTSHGVALNVCPDFSWLDYINPCGDAGRNVTSLHLLLEEHPTVQQVKEVFLARLLAGLEASAPCAAVDVHAAVSRRTGESHARC